MGKLDKSIYRLYILAETAGGAHKPEFDAWKWTSIHDLPAMIIPFKRRVYEQVVSMFSDSCRPV